MTGLSDTLSRDSVEEFQEYIANFIQALIDNRENYEIEDDELLDLIRNDD